MSGKWKHMKRRLHRWLHPSERTLRAAIRLGRMLERKETKPLPPIFGGYPVYIPMPAPMPDLMGMFARPARSAAVIPSPRGRYFKQHGKDYIPDVETVELPKFRPPRLVRYDGPPLEDDTAHETPAWLL